MAPVGPELAQVGPAKPSASGGRGEGAKSLVLARVYALWRPRECQRMRPPLQGSALVLLF